MDSPSFEIINLEVTRMRNVTHPFRAALTAALVYVSAAAANSANVKQIYALGDLGGSTSFARGINEAGTVVGEAKLANGETHAFYWKPRERRMVDLGTLGGGDSRATAINNGGVVVGTSKTSPGEYCGRAVVWTTDYSRPPRVLPDLVPNDPYSCSQPSAINERGDIVGFSSGQAVRWVDGNVEALSKPPEFDHCLANSVNDRGWITLTCLSYGNARGFLWREGVLTDIGILAGNYSNAEGINNKGQVAGYGLTSTGTLNAFLWRDSISVLDNLGGYTNARAVSENGLAAGEAGVGYDIRAVFWDRQGSITNLGALPGSTFSAAFGVNNAGTVAGVSYLNTGDPETSGFRAVIWR